MNALDIIALSQLPRQGMLSTAVPDQQYPKTILRHLARCRSLCLPRAGAFSHAKHGVWKKFCRDP